MPSLDSARGRARLSDAQLEAVVALLDRRGTRAEHHPATAELTHAGLVQDGRPSGFLADLVRDLAAADVVVDLEVAGRDGVSRHGAALVGARCWFVSGWPGEAESEYAQIDPRLLVHALALATGLQQGDPPGGRRPVACSFAQLSSALDARGRQERAAGPGDDLGPLRATTVEALTAVPGISRELADVLAAERSAWRLTASWRHADGRAVRVLAVVDAGDLGLWRREGVPEPLGVEAPPADTEIRLVPVAAAEVWREMAALLPGSAEHRA